MYRFETGSIGFASASEVQNGTAAEIRPSGLLGWLVDWLRLTPACSVTAVCMPPGARVELYIGSPEVQDSLELPDRCEAVFDEITADSFMYRDALRLPDGRVLLLQSIPEGVQARVVSLGSSPTMEEAILLDALEETGRPVLSARRW